MRGHLIVFEGPDGVGKSTLADHLRSLLDDNQIPAEILAFPGNRPGTLGKLVYDLHHSPQKLGVNDISPVGLQALHIAAHLDVIVRLIVPAMAAGNWVVLDRFWWSTWVYGRAAGIDIPVLDALIHAERLEWGSVLPSVVFLVDRGTSLGQQETGGRFAVLRGLYKEISSSQVGQCEIVTLLNENLASAKQSVTEWVNERGR